MYEITSGVYTHFAHHVRGHSGPCISLHGHTWLLQVTVAATELDKQGFVVDFDVMQKQLFGPCHLLLDHSLAIGEKTYGETREQLLQLGETLVASRQETLGNLGERQAALEGDLAGARNEFPGGIKVCVFPFSPTSERMAEWLVRLADERLCQGSLTDGRIKVTRGRIYESLQPVESYAEFLPANVTK